MADNPPAREAQWKSIARRKQQDRDACIPPEWRIAATLLPKDPPSFEDGPQNVLHIPSMILSQEEIAITEGHTVATLLAAISRRDLTAEQVTAAFCHRAAIAHQLANCLTEPLFSQARSRARFLDEYMEANGGATFGPLHGLPVSIKDTFDVAGGTDTSTGLAALCYRPATRNAALVDLLLSLGAVVVAKTNVPQTLSAVDSVNNVFGRTMNPRHRLLTAGGSSGGEGVAVAMRASMVGFGTDLGGSVRIPAMANGVYGFKPSAGRLPYGGQAELVRGGGGGGDGMLRLGVQPVAGPLARSVDDLAFVMGELVPRAGMWGEDCGAGGEGGEWRAAAAAAAAADTTTLSSPIERGAGPNGEVVIGVLRCDGNCTHLPPVERVLSEVASSLGQRGHDHQQGTTGIKVVEVQTPAAWAESQIIMNELINIDGGGLINELVNATGEPLIPWVKARFRPSQPYQLEHVARLQSLRAKLEREMLQMWSEVDEYGRRARKLDAIICPVAPHPVPEIERYGSLGYTSSFVMLDYPAGTIPIRDVVEDDLYLGQALGGQSLGTLDDACRELWDERTVDRRVYLGSPLSIQVVVPRREDQKLARVMALIDRVMKRKSITMS